MEGFIPSGALDVLEKLQFVDRLRKLAEFDKLE